MDPGSKKASLPTAWHTLQVHEILIQLGTSQETGLSEAEAARRRKTEGPNELREQVSKNPVAILIAQHTRPLVLLLWGAFLISLILNNWIDAGALFGVILASTLPGFFEESRVERALEALIQTSAIQAKVRREGQIREVPAAELVPGDILLLEDGDQVPADARLLGTLSLRVQEAPLTGQSHPIPKTPQPILREAIPPADRYNIVYMGGTIVHGWGEAVIVATGMNTELGRTASLIQSAETAETPLRRQVNRFWGKGSLAAGGLAAVAFLIGLLRGDPLPVLLQNTVLLAVAALPAAFPLVQNVVLALAARRMLHRQALVHRLPAVEALGSVNIICSDKTGTLTENHLTLTVLDLVGRPLDLTETLSAGRPVLDARQDPLATEWPGHLLLLAAGALCNTASLERDPNSSDDYHAIGDPTDGAWLVAAARLGLWKPRLDRLFPRLLEVPFSTERRRMSTIHRVRMSTLHLSEPERPITALFKREQPYMVFCKGALDSLLEVSTRVWIDGKIQPLTAERRAQICSARDRLAREGLRVQAVAFRPLASRETFEDAAYSAFEKLPPGLRHLPRTNQDIPKAEEMSAEMERDLILTGLLAVVDPPRPEVLPAVQSCWQAGIRPVMITAEHPADAVEVARSLHIANGVPPRVLTGAELSRMSSAQLEAVVDGVSIYTGVNPGQKLDIVHALQNRGHIVAITGDGITDAPALRRSDIGVAMGINGTQVSREAANLVILDNNFATIVRAVEEGRRVYEQIRLLIRLFLTCSAGEALALLAAALFNGTLPFNLLQLLWINLVAVGLPGLALTALRPEKDPMRQPPVDPRKSILSREETLGALFAGVAIGGIALLTGSYPHLDSAVLFSAFVFLQAGFSLAAYPLRRWFSRPLTKSSLVLPAALLGVVFLQVCAAFVPPLQRIFATGGLPLDKFLFVLAGGAALFLARQAGRLDRDPSPEL
ncbi:MAG TPA: cation-translocating P-type ATPase [Anaerolineaceae bacterium]|nr:cation-translocating P-type ATPase [Anaerolineaceae bacterium]